MKTDRELMQQALDALERYQVKRQDFDRFADEITALRERLAQPEQEPVACVQDLDEVKRKHLVYEKGMDWQDPLYTAPPQRKPLPPQSPCEMTQAEGKMFKLGWLECEAAHGIKGEA